MQAARTNITNVVFKGSQTKKEITSDEAMKSSCLYLTESSYIQKKMYVFFRLEIEDRAHYI